MDPVTHMSDCSMSKLYQFTKSEVFITECKIALMNAIDQVFPNSTHILCTWNIEKNILTNVTHLIKYEYIVQNILSHWSNLITISTPVNFIQFFQYLQTFILETSLLIARKPGFPWGLSL
ncbi:uncharacterized protein VP01_1159g3 [Puccinia sorghi]|uniref:Uncharacterized protein n=1 Tax=Puccinia sorghi TaxID=27349 RepID=A0A0L6VRK1_9BASI|nr:uncharacterized protein VP01_1159g3 [Puccinia sorghi]